MLSRFASQGFDVLGYRFSEGFFFNLLRIYKKAFRIRGTSQQDGIKKASFARHLNLLNRPLFIIDKGFSAIFDGASMFAAFRKPGRPGPP